MTYVLVNDQHTVMACTIGLAVTIPFLIGYGIGYLMDPSLDKYKSMSIKIDDVKGENVTITQIYNENSNYVEVTTENNNDDGKVKMTINGTTYQGKKSILYKNGECQIDGQ